MEEQRGCFRNCFISLIAAMLMGEEVCIPMPWGSIAGKAWGVNGGNPTLCIHGYNGNAAAFDGLMRCMLNNTDYFLAIDLPGNGKSDHYPKNSQLTDIEYIADIKRICLHFGWSDLNILAHSLGCRISLYFAAAFPNLIKKLAILDITAGVFLREPSHICDIVAHEVDALIYNENKVNGHISLYAEEEAFRKFKEARIVDLKDEYVVPAFLRSTKRMDNKLYFSADRRNVKLITPLITEQFHVGLVSQVSCPVLIIMSTKVKGVYEKLKTIRDTIDILKQNLKNKLSIVDTNLSHDMHIEAPDIVAPILSSFFHTHNKL